MEMSSPWVKGRRAVAKYFGTNEHTIVSWVKKGMPCHKQGKWLFFHKDEVDAWMKDSGRIAS